MTLLIDVAAVFSAALATGGLMVNWLGLARAMVRLRSATAYAEFHQATNQTFDPYMPIVVVSALVGSLALSALSPGLSSTQGQLALLGALGYAVVLAVSLTTNVPMNKQVAGWSVQEPPADWTRLRARWVRFHIVRTLVSVPAMLCCILAAR